MDLIALAKTGEIADGAAKEFSLTQYHPPLELIVIRKNQRYFAYLNRCPHTGISLNWLPDQFFDIDHEYIQCATHGALFTVDNGYCVRGPCAGASLRAVSIVIEDAMIYFKPTHEIIAPRN
ncbi:MAG: Rieske 2Fe-2S domain-containing protein [Gammaproteobacteria bacterium]|jgi:nitrite reductase/ring-hydroxylating ferredoxin subunit